MLSNAKTNGGRGRKVKTQMLFLWNTERTLGRIVDTAVGNGQHNAISTVHPTSTYSLIFEKNTVSACTAILKST